MIAVSVHRSVNLSVTRLNSAACAVCVGSFGAVFAKSLWPLVLVLIDVNCPETAHAVIMC